MFGDFLSQIWEKKGIKQEVFITKRALTLDLVMENKAATQFFGIFILMCRYFCGFVKGMLNFQQPTKNLPKHVAQTWFNMEAEMTTRDPLCALSEHL